MPTIKESIIATIRENGLPLDLGAYILTMIECAGGNYNYPCLDQNKFCHLFETNMVKHFPEVASAKCYPTRPINDPSRN